MSVSASARVDSRATSTVPAPASRLARGLVAVVHRPDIDRVETEPGGSILGGADAGVEQQGLTGVGGGGRAHTAMTQLVHLPKTATRLLRRRRFPS